MVKVLMSALQDSLTFLLLLGAQVIIVASLAVTALWLYFKRLKNQAVIEVGLEDDETQSSNVTTEPFDKIKEVHLALIRDLESKVVILEKEKLEMLNRPTEQNIDEEKRKNEELKKVNEQISERAREMESKLQEYDVIKHEIGLMAQIKTENEKLKQTLSELENKLAAITSEPKTSESSEIEKVEVFKPMESVAATEDPGIEGLLNEIEALTSEKKELERKKA